MLKCKNFRNFEKSKKSQAWVETVIYTLIGLSIIGIVLGIALPKIKEMTDRATIEQTLKGMGEMHQKILAIQSATGSSRLVDFRIKEGKLVFDADAETISYVMEDTNLLYSEVGTPVPEGAMTILTQESGDNYDISLILNYSGTFNINFNGGQTVKELTQAPTPYRILFKNQGVGNLEVTLI